MQNYNIASSILINFSSYRLKSQIEMEQTSNCCEYTTDFKTQISISYTEHFKIRIERH